MFMKGGMTGVGLCLMLAVTPAWAQSKPNNPAASASMAAPAATSSGQNLDIDFLLNYYDQDGDRSPVTGGIGTEALQVVAPMVVVRWKINEKWKLSGRLGLDTVSSASIDAMDLRSGASKVDNRVYTTAEISRQVGKNRLGFSLGGSTEYDYFSAQTGLSWSREFNRGNTALSARARFYLDTVELYGIDGRKRGEADRDSTNVSFSLSQILGRKTVASIEVDYTVQDGFLSTPFYEVILAPTAADPEGERVAERLPDQRNRTAIGVRLNHAFSHKLVQRVAYRLYDDDWDVQAHTVDLETHFRLATDRDSWLFPIVRYHTQKSSSYFAAPRTFTAADEFISSDGDLGEFDSWKFGLGWRADLRDSFSGWRGKMRSFEVRLTYYDRDDGLSSFNTSFGFGWGF